MMHRTTVYSIPIIFMRIAGISSYFLLFLPRNSCIALCIALLQDQHEDHLIIKV